MKKEKKKSKRNKNKFYVLRRGIKPGIYNSYDEALRYKYHDDDLPLIRGFRTLEEAEYYLKHGEIMPPAPRKIESPRPELFPKEALQTLRIINQDGEKI
ncbi:MAG: RNase H1/viroplasmin domain-containing protein [Chitinophagales bacterium]